MNPIPRTALVLLCCLATPIAGVGASVGAPAASAATPDEIRLLGSDQDDAQYMSYLPFTRSLAASGVVQGSLAESTAQAGIPPAAMIEALDAFAATLDLKRDVQDGDRFYVRYEQAFTAEGTPIGAGRVLWAELRTQAKGTVAIHRFKPMKAAADSFWLSTGQAATPSAIKLPLDTITVSSGFGMRADPFDQPIRGQMFGIGAGYGAAPVGKAVKGPLRGGPLGGGKGGPPPQPSPLLKQVNTPTPLGLQMGLLGPNSNLKGFGHAPVMMMHEGVDLAADIGTPIHAAGDGVIKGAQLNGGYGNWIEIEHDDVQFTTALQGKPAKISTVYGHLSAFAPGIAPGVWVKQGDIIGFVGSTGRSTGPHLHFEILQNGHPTNPMISPTLHPEQLKGGDLERFKKAVARDLSLRQAEAGSI